MDALKQQLLRIQQQLSGLSASQKMLTASLVIIMIMTMFYWARYAGTAEMEPLIDQSLSAEELSPIKSAIAAKGVSYQMSGDRILVPADRKLELFVDLAYAQLLPRDLKDGFEEIVIKYQNPLGSQFQNEQLYNHARERTLSGIISRFPGVKSATVIIDGTSKRNPLRSIQSTAAVAIGLKSGEQPSKKLADAVADLLVGAQAGLLRDNVKVTINGQSFKQADPNDPLFGGENPILEAKARYERQYADKILSVIAYIPNAYATVSVELNTKSSVITKKEVDPKGKVEALLQQETTSDENTTDRPAAEPGVTANTGVTLNESAGAAGQNSTSEKTLVKNFVDTSVTNTQTTAPAGDAVPVAAAVRVPDSYFISIWKRKNPSSTAAPTDADLESLVKEHIAPIRDAVRMATNIKDDAAISVARYVDVSEPLSGGEASAGGLASLPTGFGFGAKEIAIGVLAVVSLFMVSMMVRKSVPHAVMQTGSTSTSASSESSSMPFAITAAADLAGEVGEGGAMLTGHELSDGDIEAKQVIEQVGTMIKENPDVAVNMVKRWLSRE